MKIITRNQLFNLFKSELSGLSSSLIELMFKSVTDTELAESYGLKILRKGYFYR